jgi:hypothetical protein
MKKLFFLVLFVSFVFFPAFALAQEKIVSFDAVYGLGKDAVFVVEERIIYDFAHNLRHGIFRDIPIKYETPYGKRSISISEVSVMDENLNPYQFAVSRLGSNLRIKIGDPDVLVSDTKVYIIRYKVERAINYFEGHDEFYWNVTGNGWEVPIEKASAVVFLPGPVNPDVLKMSCFAGFFGSAEVCAAHNYVSGPAGATEVHFAQGYLLETQGLSIAVGFPKGMVYEPSAFDSVLALIKDNFIVVLPFVVFTLLFYIWRKRGRDPKGKGTITPQYEPPENLSPSEVGTILDERADPRDLSADILQLAIQGYIRIHYKEKGWLFGQPDFVLKKLIKAEQISEDWQKKLINQLFLNGEKMVKLSDFKKLEYLPLRKRGIEIYKTVTAKGYFIKNPNAVRAVYAGIGIGVIVAGQLLGNIFLPGIITVLSILLSGVIIIIFSLVMPKKTKQGAIIKEYILGLKSYIEVAEKERINFHNAPEKNPELFEKLLPYAMVFGAEKSWAQCFTDIYNTAPTWYVGSPGRVFNMNLFALSLQDFKSTANGALARGSRAATGGSAFGGGFSGGGFGGGGGGSW